MNQEQYDNLAVGDQVMRSGSLDVLTVLARVPGEHPSAGMVKIVSSATEWRLVGKMDKEKPIQQK